MMLKRSFAAAVLCLPMAAFAAPKIADFAQFNAFDDVTISPKGDYLAAKVHLKDGIALTVIRLADHKTMSTFSLGQSRDLYRYTWVNAQRLVLEPAYYWGELEHPYRSGELVAINADGSEESYLFGYRGSSDLGTAIHKSTKNAHAWATVLTALPDDPDHAIVAVNDFGTADTTVSRACKINVHSGMLSDCMAAPATGYFSFLADHTGAIRYAVSTGNDFETLETYYRNPGDKDWHHLSHHDGDKYLRVDPIVFSGDNSKVYLASNEGGDRFCLVEQTLSTEVQKELSCDPVGDLSKTILSFDDKEPVAALYDYDKPRLDFLGTDNPDKAILKQLEAGFPGNMVLPVSSTQDGSKSVLKVYSDRDPGGYYLFDVKTMKVSPLVAIMEGILPEEMGERRPVSFKARDGQTIRGYLTVPPGKQLTDLPMVVYPHGGPLDVYDTWDWNAVAQLLATHGYAVLQVNFRGSGGLGHTFWAEGQQQWGGTMINDIADGARWAIAQGYVDAKRICIYGASYGGYAAMMSAEREPDLYRCAAGLSGVYDLEKLVKDSDTSESRIGQAYQKEFIGESPEQLRAQSPVTHVDQLKAAVFIAHGTEDERAPFSQAKALRAALDAQHHPYEWLEKSGEGHGFFNEENRVELYTRLLQFLDKNIGAGSADSKQTPDSAAK